jgi:cell division transport system permease protein
MTTTSRQINTTIRIFKNGFLNLFRNAWLTIAATAVMVVALTIISIAVVLNVTANNAIDELARDLKASVYLVDGTSDSERKIIESGLVTLDFVERVEFVTQDQARTDLAGDFNNDTDILQALALAGNDVLPASLRITVSDLKRMPEIASFLEQPQYAEFIDSVSLGQTDAQATIDKAATAQGFINTSSILAAVVLSAISIMIIFNTIRMAIYTRRDEIRIMKLIGATPGYIRGPFLVEASLYGVFAGVIANVIVYSLVIILGGEVSNQKEFSVTYAFFTEPGTMIVMLLSAVLLGILIGAISSMLAMERHLKLKYW